ncbi:SCO family protein [Phycisphaeraceae bacterium D3-23]
MNPSQRQLETRRPRLLAACAVLGALTVGGLTGPASASNYNGNTESTQANPWGEELDNEVGVVERLNCDLPMDLAFTDEDGNAVTLGEYFEDGRPVILNIGYYRCPTVCGLVLKKLADTVGDTGLDMGDDFVVLNITIDPNETTEHAQQARDDAFGFLRAKDVEPNPDGWRFLTADAESIKQVTDATGYQYFYIKPQNEYGHPAVLVLATGDGVIARYMHGTAYDARTLRLSLVETSEGKTGSLLDRAFLTCFQYDPDANNYTATAKFIMMIAGGVTILFVGGGMGVLFAYEKKRRSLLESDSPTETNPR